MPSSSRGNDSGESDLAKCVRETRRLLKKGLTSGPRDHPHWAQWEVAKQRLSKLVACTLEQGQSDSVLIVGPPGSGKTTLVKASLFDCLADCDTSDAIVVTLDGRVHTDDSLALREIIREIHSDQISEEAVVTGSFADNLLFVLESLKSADKTKTKPVIFVLDEFQLFCCHPNQTLLYNLFDIVQSQQSGAIFVVGITCRVDVTELLEKRVKSRYSHRQIRLDGCEVGGVKVDRVKQRLELMRDWLTSPSDSAHAKKFNKSVADLTRHPIVIESVKRHLQLDSNVNKFKSVLFSLVCRLNETNPFITLKDVEEVFTELFADDKVELLKDLSVLELCLVVAMKHQSEIYDCEPFNFEMITARYLKFATGHFSAVQITQRPVLLMAFERIKELEIILSVGGSHSKKEYQLYGLAVTGEQIDRAIASYPGLPTEVAQWAATSPC